MIVHISQQQQISSICIHRFIAFVCHLLRTNRKVKSKPNGVNTNTLISKANKCFYCKDDFKGYHRLLLNDKLQFIDLFIFLQIQMSNNVTKYADKQLNSKYSFTNQM